MKAIRTLAAGALVLAVAGGGMLLGASSASAVTPGFEPDGNSKGSVSFYDASGNVVTSGTNLSHLADFAAASAAGRAGTNKAQLYFGVPDHTKPDSSTWFAANGSASTTFPVAAPASLASNPNPVVTLGATDANLSNILATSTLDTTAGYANIIQVRIKDSGPGVPQQVKPYFESDISYNATTGTWREISPAVADTTTTTMTATPTSASAGSAVSLDATVLGTDSVPSALVPGVGTVQFFDGTTAVGAPVTVTGTGTAHLSTTALTTLGANSITAVFTPTDPAAFATSTSPATIVTITQAVTATQTALGVSGGYLAAGSASTLTGTVTPTAAAGAVEFFDGVTDLGAGTAGAGNVYTLAVPAGFAAGSHSVVAKFTPTDPATYGSSQSTANQFITQPAVVGDCAVTGSVCTDQQNITATIPNGTIVINTPYTSTSPLDLGTFTLDPTTSSTLTASATFNDIRVTDTRSGNKNWTTQAQATDLSSGTHTINGWDLGLTNLAVTSSGAGFDTSGLAFVNNPASNGLAPGVTGTTGLGGANPHTIATAAHGLGTVDMHGTLTLIAPASTPPGTYAGTITFTVG